ncbi:phage portal protein [Vibrio breoganii]|uniref:phage portal protein n=1 Tax=Vibrio breoganii TaxID=553239 RepID=UPI000C825CC9|nr:phage portal protein [Vibrio breoganii]PMK30657.1 phage portal protein [Vibrio breoganii]
MFGFARKKKKLQEEKSTVNTHDGFVLDTSYGMGWFQEGKGRGSSEHNGVVDACIRMHSQIIGQMPIQHYKKVADGSWELQENSKVVKLLNKPNGYETKSVFMESLVNSLLYTGNTYAYAERNGGQYSSLHLMHPYGSRAQFVKDESGTHLVYTVNHGSNMPITTENVVMPRNMLHVKIFPESYDRLRGRTPIEKHGAAVATNDAINESQRFFFRNRQRPSGVMSTDIPLNREQISQLRAAFKEQAGEMEQGGIPVLGGGLKFQPISVSTQDAQLLTALRMSKQDIANAFGMPLGLIDQVQSTDGNLEALINHWMTTGLAYLMEVIAETISDFFDMDSSKEKIVLDEKSIKRTLFRERLEALGTAVQRAVYSPNEARAIEGLPPVEGGDKPYLQQQMIAVGSINPTQVQATQNLQNQQEQVAAPVTEAETE